jgi:prepilin-type N-terminal cleavage/methylation domain-containing protein
MAATRRNEPGPHQHGVQRAVEREQVMQRSSSSKAFTIIELLVVVSIIALLVGILLPAIGKARDQAQLTRSQANVKQISTAAFTYASEWADRQPTFISDNMASYGDSAEEAFTEYGNQVPGGHPWIWLGYGQSAAGAGVVYGYAPLGSSATIERTSVFQPIDFVGTATANDEKRMGSFRLVQVRAVNTYVNGRFYDPVYYAPKDTAVINSVEQVWDNANEFVALGGTARFSSYCFSAAAMFNPAVLSQTGSGDTFYQNPWSIKGGFRSPGMSQALFPNLKTHIMEHHWLQNRKKPCAPAFVNGIYDGCQPYMFNHAFNSQPVTSFFDGHVEQMGQEQSIQGSVRLVAQTGNDHNGLWSMDSPLGPPGAPAYDAIPAGDFGYFMQAGQDWSKTSYHILTLEGIKGRDLLSK